MARKRGFIGTNRRTDTESNQGKGKRTSSQQQVVRQQQQVEVGGGRAATRPPAPVRPANVPTPTPPQVDVTRPSTPAPAPALPVVETTTAAPVVETTTTAPVETAVEEVITPTPVAESFPSPQDIPAPEPEPSPAPPVLPPPLPPAPPVEVAPKPPAPIKPPKSIAKPQTVQSVPIVSVSPPPPPVLVIPPAPVDGDPKDTSQPNNAALNIKTKFKPKQPISPVRVVNEQIDTTNNTTKVSEPKPVQSLIELPKPKPSLPTAPIRTIQSIGGQKILPPRGLGEPIVRDNPPGGPRSFGLDKKPTEVKAPEEFKLPLFKGNKGKPKKLISKPKPIPQNIVTGPTFKGSPTIVRPDGVTEVLGPGGVVLEEIGRDGKITVDPIKDAGFDPKNPPESIKKLRDEFKQHVISFADENGEPFYVSEETKQELVNDGLGDVGGALTAKEQAEKLEKLAPDGDVSDLPAGFAVLQNDLIKKGIIKQPEPEVNVKKGKKAKEKVVNVKQVQANLKPRDYLATIEEVIDSNRIRVSLSYNDGVNLYKHKGEDDVSKRFKGFKVNYLKNNIQRYKTYVKVGSQYYLVVNSVLGVDGRQRTLKVKQPLVDDVQLNEGFTFVEKRLPDYQDRIRLVPFEDEDREGIFLRLPNFNSVDNPINFQGTNYQTHTGMLSDNDQDSQDIERLLISGSLLDVQPNVDYQKTTTNLNLEADDTGFGNFIHFSNAESRLRNFRDKLELIEGYNTESSSLVNITSSLSTIQEIERKRQRVKNSFDPFEHYMYYESSSYVSSSDGQFHDTSWPKSNSSKPYTLEAVGSTNANTWFNNMIASASDYDQRNMNSLRNSLPEHIYADTSNNVFLEFMDMVGQYFDEVWTYTKSITDLNVRVNKLSEGISKDVAIHYARALGLDIYNGNDLLTLPNYLLGKNQDGSDLYESPQEEVTEKIWKRILANLPFFLKTKGTERALKGLLNCYGIPSTMLRVREYGGPDKGTRVSYEIKRRFTRALDFRGSQYLRLQWDDTDSRKPFTTEFRFKTSEKSDQTLMHSDDNWCIQLINNSGTEYGFLRFAVSSSQGVERVDTPEQKFHNGDFWSVMLTRASSSGDELSSDAASLANVYELTANQYDSTKQRIIYRTSSSLEINTAASASAFTGKFLTSGRFFLGESGSAGTGGEWGNNGFSGSMMEFRWWSQVLSGSVFDNHTRTPKAYNGNYFSSSYDNLLFRLPLDDNRDFSVAAQQTASSAQFLQTYGTEPAGISGSENINGFTGNFFKTVVDQEKIRVPSLGPTRRNATKIRIEEIEIDKTKPLMVDRRKEEQKSSNNFAAKDEHQLGVYFSPVDVVNEDIMYSIADFNFDDYIGDPRDQFKPIYPSLRDLRKEYFKRYDMTNNFFDYLRLLNFYDNSIYDTLRQFIPARAKSTLGVLIEPNILERNKQVIGKPVEFDNQYFENANDFDEGIKVTRIVSGSDDNYFVPSGEYTTYNGLINLGTFDTASSLGFLNQRSLVKLDEIDKRSEFGTLYATASIVSGSHNNIFTEVLQPNITGSRLSETSQVERFFYSSSLSASIGPSVAYSSSFDKSDVESMAITTNLFRAFIKGTLLTRDNTIDGEEPVIINEVAPTVLKTQDSEQSKLRTE